MKTKTQSSFSLKLLVISVFIAFLLLFVLRSRLTSSGENTSFLLSASSISNAFLPRSSASSGDKETISCSSPKCNNKIPSSVAKSLIHYATSNTTPQQKLDEISITSNILDKKSPCNFLVFGLGHDSLMWHTLNFGGRTIFLDEDIIWIEKIKKKFPMLESYHVTYDSKVKEANVLMEAGKKPDCTTIVDPRYSKCQLALKGLPNEIYDIKWDLIMVDAPTGFHKNAPGRMTAIYTAGMMARNKENGETHVFVHDVHRNIEDKFSRQFLCDGYMKEQVGKLRHFTIPSHKNNLNMPFCP
ncbi:PREDICTED: glucuronoxylan 4-O-methyltransferase 1-like [Nicotiana attenuata]|uniref:glucuronoxylan 4-O-methyltransferase 1-like n=1 Tax=Nicotiana attenuata TaxID=49451 RepID=UPI0009053A02|nr:PREDICTED: glucuronoxylan 4-O-methyltransferase 1-like [Nicotiana attenuata]